MVEDADPDPNEPDVLSRACRGWSLCDDDRVRLVAKHEPMFRAMARRLHTRPDEMEDTLQGARLGFLIALKRFDPTKGSSIGSYARGFVAKEILVATFRDKRSRTQAIGPAGMADVPDAFVAQIDDGFERADEACDAPMIRAFLSGLPPVQREVAIRLAIHGATAVEIADERGVSVRAIWKTWSKVRAVGKDQLRDVFAA